MLRMFMANGSVDDELFLQLVADILARATLACLSPPVVSQAYGFCTMTQTHSSCSTKTSRSPAGRFFRQGDG